MDTVHCPRCEQLRQLLAGPPEGPAGERLAAHARACPACRRTLKELTRGLGWPRSAVAALVAACALLLALGAAGGAWYLGVRAERAAEQAQQEAERAARAAATERAVKAALQEAKALGEEAARLRGNPDQWHATLERALSAVKRAEALAAEEGTSAELRQEVRRVGAELDQAERDRALLRELDDVRLRRAGPAEEGFGQAAAARRYEAAFREYGLEVPAPKED
jgi:hypothetical protein